MPIQPIAKSCPGCQVEFIPTGKNAARQKYCTVDCQSIHYRKRNGLMGAYPKSIATGTVGAISELRVCVDLMAKGLELFRCMSPHSTADLIVVVGRLCYRIAVKTAYESQASGKISHAQERHDYDILAAVTPTDIVYMDASGAVIDPTALNK